MSIFHILKIFSEDELVNCVIFHHVAVASFFFFLNNWSLLVGHFSCMEFFINFVAMPILVPKALAMSFE